MGNQRLRVRASPNSLVPFVDTTVGSFDEAIEWLKRAPFEGGDFEVREIFQQA